MPVKRFDSIFTNATSFYDYIACLDSDPENHTSYRMWTYRRYSVCDGAISDVSCTFDMPYEAKEYYKQCFSSTVRFAPKWQESWVANTNYGHPFLRSTVDTLTAIALSKMEGRFTDIGSKYHKISSMINFTFDAYRGRFAPYDSVYLAKYKPASNVVLREQLVNELTELHD